jgi:peptidoglycan hydrolase-like protein with peptidoglycan-binding domain
MPYTIPFYAYTTSRFGETAGRTNAHRGHDVAPGGQMFPSWVVGTVVQSYWHSCLGNVVVVKNDADGYYIGVSHLANRVVGVGARVGIGSGLGNIGTTGTCTTGRHAHITVSASSPYPHSGPVQDPVQYANSAGAPAGDVSGLGYGLTIEAQLSLQRAMSHTGRYTGAHDGQFGTMSVKGMQQWLKDLGYLSSTYAVDGVPGPTYGKALQELARDKGGYTGVIDGVPGAATSKALIYWAEVVVIQNNGGTSSDYAYGLNMEAQRQIQAALKHMGRYSGVVDGVFGPASVAAMQQYLRDHGFVPADYGIDGIPGPTYGLGLQKLAALHGYTGAMDGVPGDKTSAALIAWAGSIIGGTQPAPTPTPTPPTGKWPLTGAFGIDVATTQRDIDFNRAKADGTKFVIVKMGGLNVTPQYVAPYYHNQVQRARAAGLKVGHYYLIGLGQTPEEQAGYFVRNLHDFRPKEDVLALDNEKLDANGTFWTDPAAARFIAEVIRLTGISPSRIWHYAGASDYRGHAPWPLLSAIPDLKFWWAAYGANNGTRDHEPSIQGSIPRVDVHQFSSKVAIAGYELDGNWSPHTVEQLFAEGTVVIPDVPEPPTDPDIPDVPGVDLPAISAALDQIVAAVVLARKAMVTPPVGEAPFPPFRDSVSPDHGLRAANPAPRGAAEGCSGLPPRSGD